MTTLGVFVCAKAQCATPRIVSEKEGWTVCYSHYVKKNDEAMDHTTVSRSDFWGNRDARVGVLEELSFVLLSHGLRVVEHRSS